MAYAFGVELDNLKELCHLIKGVTKELQAFNIFQILQFHSVCGQSKAGSRIKVMGIKNKSMVSNNLLVLNSQFELYLLNLLTQLSVRIKN